MRVVELQALKLQGRGKFIAIFMQNEEILNRIAQGHRINFFKSE